MKSYVVIINSILLMMMATLAMFQTACTPITPSLDRRSFIKPKTTDTVNESSTASGSNASTYSKLDPVQTQVRLFVNEIDPEDPVVPAVASVKNKEGCTITTLGQETLDIFKNYGQIENIHLTDAKSAQFEFDLDFEEEEYSLFKAEEILVELTNTGPNTWTIKPDSNQDYQLIAKVQSGVTHIQWKVCTNKQSAKKEKKSTTKNMTQDIAFKSQTLF